jgi:hypothetical protein
VASPCARTTACRQLSRATCSGQKKRSRPARVRRLFARLRLCPTLDFGASHPLGTTIRREKCADAGQLA